MSTEFQNNYEGPPPIDFEPGPSGIDIDLFQSDPSGPTGRTSR